MINTTKIQEWIRQIEEYPLIAPFIIRRLADRMIELDTENEELRAENFSLQDGQKIKELKQKISDLEYQLELLKRQLESGGRREHLSPRILAYHPTGLVLSFPVDPDDLQIPGLAPLDGAVNLLGVYETDELLFLFSSGRIETLPVRNIPVHTDIPDGDSWTAGYQVGLRGREELASVISITSAPTLQSCVQISRKGYLRSVTSDYFQLFLSRHSVGSGVKTRGDQIFQLVLCNPEDVLVLFSREGSFFVLPVQNLTTATEETIKLSLEDYLVQAVRITPQDKENSIHVASSMGQLARIPADIPALLKNTAKRGKKVFPAGGEAICGAGLAAAGDKVVFLGNEGGIKAAAAADLSTQDGAKAVGLPMPLAAMVILAG